MAVYRRFYEVYGALTTTCPISLFARTFIGAMNKKKCIPLVEQMLRDRGYDGTPIFGDDTVQATNSTTGETVHVHFVTGKKKGLGVGDVRAILEETPEDDRLILVYETSITYYAKQAIQQRANVETFQAKTLYYNVTKHVMVPPHRLLSPGEKEDMLISNHVNEDQCKKILATDPVAKYYGARPGQMFEIKRRSPEGREYNVYRVVV